MHDDRGDGQSYSYKRPRVLRIPGVAALWGSLVFATDDFVLGVFWWVAHEDEDGSSGARFGIGPLFVQIYAGRLLSRRAVRKRLAAELIAQTEQHLREQSR